MIGTDRVRDSTKSVLSSQFGCDDERLLLFTWNDITMCKQLLWHRNNYLKPYNY